MKRAIITDDIDLSSKKIYTENEFYTSDKMQTKNEHVILTHDSSSCATQQSDSEFYAVVSISDKLINGRKYSYDSWKQTVIDGSWIKPYNKPILRNHVLSTSDSIGRIQNVFMIDNASRAIVAKSIDEELPKEVIDFFTTKGVFETGTGTLICRFTADTVLAERIKSGLDVTVSQSSFMGKATCSICGNDYFEGKCNHFAGEFYLDEKENVNKLCYITAEDFDPIELSIVNLPANDMSIIYTYDKKCCSKKNKDSVDVIEQTERKDETVENTEVVDTVEETKDSTEPESIVQTGEPEAPIENAEPVQDTTVVEEPKSQDNTFLKEIAKKYLKDQMNITEDNKEAFEKLFETSTTDQLEALYKIISLKPKDSKEPVVEHKDDEQTDKIEPESTEPTTDDETKDETKDNKTEDLHNMYGKFFNTDNKKENAVTYDPMLQAMIKNL